MGDTELYTNMVQALDAERRAGKLDAGTVDYTDLTAATIQSLSDHLAGTTTMTGAQIVADSTVAAALAGKAQVLTPTAVKTGAYTAAAGEFVPVDTTSAGVTVTLPTAPPDKTRIGVKHVVRGSTNTVTVAAGGSDVFNVTSGSTSLTLTLVNQAISLQYKASGAIWYVIADDEPLSGLDARYRAAYVASGTATLSSGAATVSNASVTANSIIRVASKTAGGTPGALYISARTASTSFVISSTSGTDTSTVQWDVVAW